MTVTPCERFVIPWDEQQGLPSPEEYATLGCYRCGGLKADHHRPASALEACQATLAKLEAELAAMRVPRRAQTHAWLGRGPYATPAHMRKAPEGFGEASCGRCGLRKRFFNGNTSEPWYLVEITPGTWAWVDFLTPCAGEGVVTRRDRDVATGRVNTM